MARIKVYVCLASVLFCILAMALSSDNREEISDLAAMIQRVIDARRLTEDEHSVQTAEEDLVDVAEREIAVLLMKHEAERQADEMLNNLEKRLDLEFLDTGHRASEVQTTPPTTPPETQPPSGGNSGSNFGSWWRFIPSRRFWRYKRSG